MQRTCKLGENTEILRIGLGGNRLEADAASRQILAKARELGVNFFDTADIYNAGESERIVGEVLKDDSSCVIATKGGYHSGDPDNVAASIEASRERLNRDVIDLYYLHRPDPDVPLEHSVDPILSAHQDGRIRQIGLSSVTLDQLDRIRKLAPIAAVQNGWNCERQDQGDVIDYCERHGIVFVPYFPLRGSKRAKKLARAHEITRTQAVLAAMLARSECIAPIPGTRNPEHLAENVQALEIVISEQERERLGF